MTPAAPVRLAVVTEPPVRTEVDAPFGLGVVVEDAYGNVVTSY